MGSADAIEGRCARRSGGCSTSTSSSPSRQGFGSPGSVGDWPRGGRSQVVFPRYVLLGRFSYAQQDAMVAWLDAHTLRTPRSRIVAVPEYGVHGLLPGGRSLDPRRIRRRPALDWEVVRGGTHRLRDLRSRRSRAAVSVVRWRSPAAVR